MSVVVCTGTRVVPGDVIYCGSASSGEWDRVVAGEGSCTRTLSGELAEERQIVATRLGVVQWSESTVSVHCARGGGGAPADLYEGPAVVFGPRLGDDVHLRVARVSRSFVCGEIIAVNGVWCSGAGAFRGVVRVEDVRPFRPTKDKLTPPPPSAGFHAGDVAIATVLSQSDVRQYQLSTVAEHCGVVDAVVVVDNVRVRLRHIAGRRDAMWNPVDGTVHYRWCPLIHPKAA